MRLRRVLRQRLRSIFKPSEVENDLQQELAVHLEQLTKEYKVQGLGEDEAHLAARRAFGGAAATAEQCRDTRRLGLLEDIGRDLAYALRVLAKSPGFTATAVLSLALGIGANTAVFSVIDALMLRVLPVRNPEQLVAFFEDSPDGHAPVTYGTSYEWVKSYGRRTRAFSDVAAVSLIDREVLTNRNSGPARIALVSGNYFSMLGAGVAMGRALTPDDDRNPGGHPVAVIAHSYWESHFGEDPNVLAQKFTLNGAAYTIVGVASQGFSGEWIGRPADIWIPAMQQAQAMPEYPALLKNSASWLRPFARLAPGVTLAAAQAAIQPVYQDHYWESWPHPTPQQLQFMAHSRLLLRPAGTGFSPQRDSFGQALIILMVCAGLVLLIASANVANLLLARAAARQREMAVRLAIGASRPRIVRQLITEGVLLASIAGLTGLLFSVWGTKVLALAGTSGPVVMDVRLASNWISFDLHPDWRVFLFTFALCLITGVLFGLAPAFGLLKRSLAPTLAGRGSTTGGPGRLGPGRLLVVSQVSMSLLLVVGAGLFLRTLANLRAQDLGIERQRLLLVWSAPSGQDAALSALIQTIQARLSALPGVLSASMTSHGFLQGDDGGGMSEFLRIQGQEPKPGMRGINVAVSPGFFNTAGMRIVAGRDFSPRDIQSSPKVAILSESAVRFFFGEENPIGKRLKARPADPGYPYEIVGVASNAKYGTVRDGRFIEYLPVLQNPALMRSKMCIAVRTAGNPMSVAASVRRELRDIDPNLPVLRMDTVEEQLDSVLAQERVIATLTTFFGALTLLLACMGLYGVISYAVARRTGEIGLRIALGATSGVVMRQVLRESILLAAAGIVIGTLAAFAAARLLSSRLFGVEATDPRTFAACIALMILVTLLGGFLPARRASSVDPVEALRHE
jgi:predicted permease